MRALAALLALLLVPGCLSPDAPAAQAPPADARTDAAALRPLEETYEGTARATPATPFVADFVFPVPSGAIGVNGTLTWEGAPARFRLELLDPWGEVVAKGWQEGDGRISLATVEPVRPGDHTFRVSATVGLDVPFALVGRAELIVPQDNVLRETLELGAASFYEANLIMEEGASFTFTFTSDAPVKWDIHSHPKGGVKYWHEGEGTSANQTFTAPARGVYSVLFESTAPATLTYEVLGAFRVHSHGG